MLAQLLARVSLYLEGHDSRRELEGWMAPQLQELCLAGDKVWWLASTVELCFYEIDAGLLTEREAKRFLRRRIQTKYGGVS